jgi:hypothetical protein
MIIKNPDKLLKEFIPTINGDLWYVNDLSVTMDEDGTTYTYKMSTDIPVKSSPNQQYYNMTRRMEQEVKLRFDGSMYDLYCSGQIWRGHCSDIDTMDKFIKKVADMLPKY